MNPWDVQVKVGLIGETHTLIKIGWLVSQDLLLGIMFLVFYGLLSL